MCKGSEQSHCLNIGGQAVLNYKSTRRRSAVSINSTTYPANQELSPTCSGGAYLAKLRECASGTLTETNVPSSSLSMFNEPRSSFARLCILATPWPSLSRSVSNPTPSSRIASVSNEASTVSLISTREHLE